MLLSGSVVLYVASCIVFSAVADRDIVIPTDAGSFLGQLDDTIEHNGEKRSVKRFLGIPFAKPPVGDRRFAKPEVPDVMEKVYNATYYRPHCPQEYYHSFLSQDEDCLYLNVYVPGGGRTTSNKTFPVMIWIHGGSFRFGKANSYNGDVLSSFNDVIVVTVHYRLNVFGFLSDEEDLHGNYGMWDQRLAIEWVNKHIESFGGDKGRITLCGESAGAASVLYQALYPGNKGLFHRVIAQSGSILAPWALQKNPARYFRDFVKRANCNKDNSQQTLLCLRNLSVKDLLSNIKRVDILFEEFAPSIDGDFLKADPATLLMASSDYAKTARQHFKSLDYLSGVNSKENGGSVAVYWAYRMKDVGIDFNLGVPKSFFDQTFVPELVQPIFSSKNDNIAAITKAVLHQYTDCSNPDSTIRIRDQMIHLESDVYFFVSAIKIALEHADSERGTYFYEFDHKPWFMPEPVWLTGALHGMELPFVFGLTDSVIDLVTMQLDYFMWPPPGREPRVYTPTVEEAALASKVMALWTNFAKTGNPTSPDVSGVPDWPVYDSSSQSYLQISMNMKVKRRLAAERYAFWTEVVPSLQHCRPPGVCQPECPTSATPASTQSGSIYKMYLIVMFSLHFATAFTCS